MKPLDFAKAGGIATAVLLVDVVLAVAVVYAWSMLIDPGHSRAYYASAGVPIALASTRLLGSALIFGACWMAARRNPARNAIAFAVTVACCYAVLDGASVAFHDFFRVGMAITMGIKLLAAVAGAALGRLAARTPV